LMVPLLGVKCKIQGRKSQGGLSFVNHRAQEKCCRNHCSSLISLRLKVTG
jgi:hypothetical protein